MNEITTTATAAAPTLNHLGKPPFPVAKTQYCGYHRKYFRDECDLCREAIQRIKLPVGKTKLAPIVSG